MKFTKVSAESNRGENRRFGHVNEESGKMDHPNSQIFLIDLAS